MFARELMRWCGWRGVKGAVKGKAVDMRFGRGDGVGVGFSFLRSGWGLCGICGGVAVLYGD